MGGNHSYSLSDLTMEIWNWCIDRLIIIHAECPPGVWNIRADQESHHTRNSSDWKLDRKVFLCLGTFSIDLPYVGKIWRGKILANLANSVQFAKIFRANSYKYSEITEDLPAGSPKFSSPFASSVMIRQNFIPPKFSHVRYLPPG